MTRGLHHYDEGRSARTAGLPLKACPYVGKTPARTGWFAGWYHRRAEERALEDWRRVTPSGSPDAPDAVEMH